MNLPEFRNPFSNGVVVGSGVTSEQYQKHPAMSRGALIEFRRCPRRWKSGYKAPESDAKDWGSLLDCLVLTPAEFPHRYAVQPETYPAPEKHARVKSGELKPGDPLPWNNNATFCSEWTEAQEALKKTVISAKDEVEVSRAADEILNDASAGDLIRSSKRQVMVTADYTDRETGIVVAVKILIDLLPARAHPEFGKCLADLKTTTSAAHGPYLRQVNNYGYHVQAALYLDVYTAATKEDRIEFRHVVQESYPPYQVGRRLISAEFIEIGRMTYMDALAKYAKCLAENNWPDYDCGDRSINGWSLVEPEAWMVKE